MNTPKSINDLDHEDIRAWLERALHDKEVLTRLTPDEPPHLGILRLEKTLKPAARDSLRDGSLQLIRQFCSDGRGETTYLEQLLALISAFKNAEAVQLLAQLAHRFSQMPQISVEIRLAVLAALVDTPPPQPAAFWIAILKQNSVCYAGLALSGVLATNPAQAINMLPAMPDTERAGQAAVLKFDLTWDDLPPKKRFQFTQDIEATLPQCGSRFARPVRTWIGSKEEPIGTPANLVGLRSALAAILGTDFAPQAFTPKLCPCEAA